MIRSRTRWFEHGEKPSKYFLNLEKRSYVDKSIRKIVKNDGTSLTSSNDILLEARVFYQNLYEDKENDVDLESLKTLFTGLDNKTLSDSQQNSLEGPITYNELLQALKNSKNGKSPGSDGFSI